MVIDIYPIIYRSVLPRTNVSDVYFGSIVYHLYFTDNNVMFANANTFTLTYTNHMRKELLIVDCLRITSGDASHVAYYLPHDVILS